MPVVIASKIRRDPLHLPIAIADRVQSPTSVMLAFLRLRQFQFRGPGRGPALPSFRQRARRGVEAHRPRAIISLGFPAPHRGVVLRRCGIPGERAGLVGRGSGNRDCHLTRPSRTLISTPDVRLAHQRQGLKPCPRAFFGRGFLMPGSWCPVLGAGFLACSLPIYRRVLGVMFEGWELWPWHHARQRRASDHAARDFHRARTRPW
jgi:hypothetical protein